MGNYQDMLNTQTSYDQVAQEYADRIYDELKHKAFDRKMLDWLIEKVGQQGIICDFGCGPGQVARYLHEHGARACGIDLSPQMIEQARKLNPGLDFEIGDMLRPTNVPDNAYAGIAAFYSIIHIPRLKAVDALREIARVLRPGGVLLVAFHIGSEVTHLDEWWGKKVDVDFTYFEREEMKQYLSAAGFELEEAIERDPYPGIEVQTRRAYIFARKKAEAK